MESKNGFKMITRLPFKRTTCAATPQAVLSRVDMGLSYATTQDDVKYGVAAGRTRVSLPVILYSRLTHRGLKGALVSNT